MSTPRNDSLDRANAVLQAVWEGPLPTEIEGRKSTTCELCPGNFNTCLHPGRDGCERPSLVQKLDEREQALLALADVMGRLVAEASPERIRAIAAFCGGLR